MAASTETTLRCRSAVRRLSNVGGSCACVLIAGWFTSIVLCSGASIYAQATAAKAADQSADAATPKRPFNLPSLSGEVTESLEDFERYSKRAAWERAFKSLQKVLEANPNAMVSSADGFLLSVRIRLVESIARLPSEGKEAYRLFYDPEAKKLLAEAQGAAELEKLNKVFAAYFATSAGDVAADRLGDLYFEQGEFSKAVECWDTILRYRPESDIPRVRLLVKNAIALARAGRWDEFHAIERIVRDRHAGESVSLAGREVDASKHLATLAASESPRSEPATKPSPAANDAPIDIKLTDRNEPIWQFRYFSEATAKLIANVGQDWGARSTVSTMVPPAILVGSRLFVNLSGHHFCLDTETGKLLWRTAKFHDLGQKFQNNRFFVFPEQFAIASGGDRLFCVAPKPQEIGNQNALFRLSCLNPADGKIIWNSESVDGLKEWSFCGQLAATSNQLFACCSSQQKATELHLMAMDAASGKPLWNVLLGTHQADQRQMYYARTAQPSLLLHGNKLYVDTHSGALVEVGADTGSLNWSFQYDSEMVDNQNWYYYQTTSLSTAGAPIALGDMLYFKGMRSPRLYALDVSGPKLVWQRPVSKSSMLVSIDGQRLLLAGEEMTSLALENRSLQWSNRLPVATSMIRPAVTPNRVYQFSPRGVFEIDKSSGDVVRTFRGADLGSLGGYVFVTPQAMVTVSNIAVTAYALESGVSAAHKRITLPKVTSYPESAGNP